jgi:predicted tellurium resistance membrane protein TerC
MEYQFTIITIIAGLFGVPLGYVLAQRLRSKFPHIDPLTFAIWFVVSLTLIIATSLDSLNDALHYTVICIGQVLINLNWSVMVCMNQVSTQQCSLFPLLHT